MRPPILGRPFFRRVASWGFVRSLLQLVQGIEQVFNETMETASISREKALFMVAFKVRRRFDKIDSNLLGALGILSDKLRSREAIA